MDGQLVFYLLKVIHAKKDQTRENLQPITVTRGKELNNKYGYYRHDDFLGVPYGFKVGARNKQGFVHLLRPTPELWTLSLPHRTQILYLADIAFITSWLDLKPGARVVEAGACQKAKPKIHRARGASRLADTFPKPHARSPPEPAISHLPALPTHSKPKKKKPAHLPTDACPAQAPAPARSRTPPRAPSALADACTRSSSTRRARPRPGTSLSPCTVAVA